VKDKDTPQKKQKCGRKRKGKWSRRVREVVEKMEEEKEPIASRKF